MLCVCTCMRRCVGVTVTTYKLTVYSLYFSEYGCVSRWVGALCDLYTRCKFGRGQCPSSPTLEACIICLDLWNSCISLHALVRNMRVQAQCPQRKWFMYTQINNKWEYINGYCNLINVCRIQWITLYARAYIETECLHQSETTYSGGLQGNLKLQ